MHIVVWDPSGELLEGTHIEGVNQIPVLRARGVVLLPIDTDIAERNPVAGYFRRSWGKGWAYDAVAGQRGCPMLIYAQEGRPFLHWVARIKRVGPDMRGQLRLVGNSSVPSAMSGGLSATVEAVNLTEMAKELPGDEWTIGGRVALALSNEGYLGLSVYGAARDCVVLWSAVSQSRQER